MKRQNVRTLSLIVVTFTYLLLGAAVFDALESEFEGTEDRRLHELANQLRFKYNMSQDDFDEITQLGIQMKPYKAGTQWKFAGAFYFATTVITTIGYGHSTPKTTEGKIFCMCYAVPGIPLCLVMFQSIGERMNTIITWILRQVKKLLSCKNRSVSQTNLMIISFTTGSTVLTIGAAVFSRYEDWGYLDSFYYCFITLTTIGFGDFVALQRNDSLAKRPDYVAFSLIFILFGLTVVSSVMNLLVLRFLTMNTEDERRDQLEAAAHAQELRRLRGDVIWVDQTNVVGREELGGIHSVKQSQPIASVSLATPGIDSATWTDTANGSQLKHLRDSGIWSRLQSWLIPIRSGTHVPTSTCAKTNSEKSSSPALKSANQRPHGLPQLTNLYPRLTHRPCSTEVGQFTCSDYSTQFKDWHPYPGSISQTMCSNQDPHMITSNPFTPCDPLSVMESEQDRTIAVNHLFAHPEFLIHKPVCSHLDPGRIYSPSRGAILTRQINPFSASTTAWFDNMGCWHEDVPMQDPPNDIIADDLTDEGTMELEEDELECMTDQKLLDPLNCSHKMATCENQSQRLTGYCPHQTRSSKKDNLTDEEDTLLYQYKGDVVSTQCLDDVVHVDDENTGLSESSNATARLNRSSI